MIKNTSLIEKIDITINQNWSSVRQAFQKIVDMRVTGNFKKLKTDVKEWGAHSQYIFNHFGSLDYEEELTNGWDSWSGTLFESFLPWANTARNAFKNLDYEGVSWSVIKSDIKLHSDIRRFDEEDLPQCKINYIVNSVDSRAITTFYNINTPKIEKSYLSLPNTAWLVDTNHLHKVTNNGYREVLQFKFNHNFDDVFLSLKERGPIMFQ